MRNRHYLGWIRDHKGRILSRPVKTISNAVTTFCNGSHTDPKDGLGNTTPHIIYTYT